MGKTKFNKMKCKSCIYHGHTSGLHVSQIFCNYATVTGHTCLRRTDKGEVIDTRGNEKNYCRLYESGKSRKSREEWSC